ncbi:hypothetical protein BD779DRAFT_1531145 [Infundibulicybe gibba]|nr:hypothetical protein BD779DRAFT_1531145 [Infundibulicybe gibba]
MSDIVIREVAKDVWTFSRPFARFGWFPIGGRSTAVKLRDGGVWVLASTPLNDETKKTLDRMGPVKYIIGADAEHTMFLGEFKKAYPNAKLIAPQAAIDLVKDTSFSFDGAWGKDPASTRYGFEDDIKAIFFSGFKNKDVAFLHSTSKTLIQADLLFNLPATEQYSKSTTKPTHIPFVGGLSPTSWLHPRILWNLGIDKDAMRRDAKAVADWDFKRIIPCHGDVIEKDAHAAWRAAYKFYLD